MLGVVFMDNVRSMKVGRQGIGNWSISTAKDRYSSRLEYIHSQDKDHDGEGSRRDLRGRMCVYMQIYGVLSVPPGGGD